MWQPDPGWDPLPGAGGPATLGLWRVDDGDGVQVVKRLVAPGPDDPAELSDPTHPAYWRREADLAAAGVLEDLPGLRAPVTHVEEDDDGLTLTRGWVDDAAPAPTLVAGALARLATVPPDAVPSSLLARDLLRRRLARTVERGGWTTLARTPARDLAAAVWRRREEWLDRLDRLPCVLVHGDATPANLRGLVEQDVVALDWGALGPGPAGADLGYHALAARADLATLVAAHTEGARGRLRVDDVLLAARLTLACTALTRAEWALTRVESGGGDLAAGQRHPSVAPYLRSLERHADDLAALVGTR